MQKEGKVPQALLESVALYIRMHYEEAFLEKAVLPERRVFCNAMPAATEAAAPIGASLEELLKQADAGFSERLLQLIDRRGCKDSQIYKKANISKQHFSKIRNNPDYRPTKPTAVALALALELDLTETDGLLESAGFTLSNSSKFDLIIRYCIENRIYDIVQINILLYEFDQPLLGTC